jgi:hypothetical protein
MVANAQWLSFCEMLSREMMPREHTRAALTQCHIAFGFISSQNNKGRFSLSAALGSEDLMMFNPRAPNNPFIIFYIAEVSPNCLSLFFSSLALSLGIIKL